MTGKSVRIEVKIFGERYTLLGDKSPEQIREIAEYVDGVMCEVAKRNSRLGLSRVAVLTALNIASEMFDRGYRPNSSRQTKGPDRQKKD